MLLVQKEIGKTDATTMANYILQSYGPMSHLKLQKLLFYTQAYHLAYFNEPLFNEEFEAWVHGPVCREVYNDLKGASVLYTDIAFDGNSNPKETINDTLMSDQLSLINDTLEMLSTWSALELENATHNELPWKEAREGYEMADRCTVKISKDTMRQFYKSEVGK